MPKIPTEKPTPPGVNWLDLRHPSPLVDHAVPPGNRTRNLSVAASVVLVNDNDNENYR